ncbi:MAG: SDR family oxidoreductase [Polyangiaceae bacterium]|nr:SDR family oxidoreductase [Polyangiaceae bacterium]
MARRGYDEEVLVTGFPSFRARKMVEHLLAAEPKTLVHVLVKPQFETEAARAVGGLPPEQRKRLVCLAGDAASMDLGLSGKEYRELAGAVDRFHHVAQITYPGAEREVAEQLNVGGAREVVEFARYAKQLQSVVVHSSAVVSGNRTGVVREDELVMGQTFRTPVEETLARAERLLGRYSSELPIVIVRPTQIVGDSRTGEVDSFDGPYMLILLIVGAPQDLPVPLPTRGDAPMNLVPIDYVVRAAHRIGRRADARGRTFHIADPRPLTVRRVFELVANAGGKRLPGGFIPTNITKALLSAPGVHLVSKSPRAFVDLLSTPVRYDTTNADAALAGSAIDCPPFEDYVDALVAYVKKRVAERRQGDGAEAEDALL